MCIHLLQLRGILPCLQVNLVQLLYNNVQLHTSVCLPPTYLENTLHLDTLQGGSDPSPDSAQNGSFMHRVALFRHSSREWHQNFFAICCILDLIFAT
jgi:hypothetical protein